MYRRFSLVRECGPSAGCGCEPFALTGNTCFRRYIHYAQVFNNKYHLLELCIFSCFFFNFCIFVEVTCSFVLGGKRCRIGRVCSASSIFQIWNIGMKLFVRNNLRTLSTHLIMQLFRKCQICCLERFCIEILYYVLHYDIKMSV